MPKTKNTAASEPLNARGDSRAHVDSDEDTEVGTSNGGAFFSIQKPLIHLIEEYLITHPDGKKSMTMKAFCELSGLTVANMTAIINGNRWAAKCSRETIEKLAAALEIPVLQIFILSGFITGKDVVFSANIEETVEAIYRRMVKDSRMHYRAPTEAVWEIWPMSAKLSLCMMYEEMIGKVLLRYASS